MRGQGVDDSLRKLEIRQLALKKLQSVLPYVEMMPEISDAARTGVKTYKDIASKAHDILCEAQGRDLEEALKKFDMLLPEEETQKIDKLWLEMSKLNDQGFVQRMEGPHVVYGREPTATNQSFFMKKTVPWIYVRDDEVAVHPLLDHQDRQNAQPSVSLLPRVRQRQLAESGGRNSQPATEIDPEAGLPMLPPVVPADQTEELQQRCSKYSTKALVFAITMLAAYLGSSSSSRSVTFWIAMAAYFVAICADFISVCARTTPERGRALVYLSSFLLATVSYLLLVSFNKDYGYAILPVPLPIVAAFLHRKLRPAAARQQGGTSDQDLERIFEWSAGVVNCGGFVSMILGHYVVEPNKPVPVTAAGFFFFYTMVLGLYLMMLTTLRNAAVALHARYLAALLMVLLLSTLVAILVHGFPR